MAKRKAVTSDVGADIDYSGARVVPNQPGSSLVGASSKRVCDVLGEETPEECIAKFEAEINRINKEIERLKNERKAKEETLPNMGDLFDEKECLEYLSRSGDFTEKELDLVKKGQAWRKLYERYEKKGSYKDELARKLMGRLELLDDDDRKLLFARYLSRKNILLFSSDSSGRLPFYYYSDDIASNYREICDNLKNLGLDKFVNYGGDFCYNIDDSIVKEARERVFDETLSEDSISIKGEIKKIDEIIEQLNDRKLKISKEIQAVNSYGLPVEKALSILEWRESINGVIKNEFIDRKNDVYVFLSDYSYNSGGGGMEYGVMINVKRGDNTSSKRIAYRDAYNSHNDDWSLNYERIDSVDVQPDKAIVHVSNDERVGKYVFNIKKSKSEGVLLSDEDRVEFEEKYKRDVKSLLSSLTRWNGVMPSNYDIIVGEVMPILPYDKSYDEAVVLDKYCRFGEGIARVVIKAQIDASADGGKQFGRYKYQISPSGDPILLDYETADQSELKRGKRIDMYAE